MNRFLNKLFRGFQTPGKSRRSGPPSRRTVLQVDGLEDRVVLSSAGISGSTLNIDVSAGTNVILSELNPTGNRQIEVVGANLDKTFSINSIRAVNITVSGGSEVIVDDSDGMPFASGSTISLSGSGSNNLLALQGSRAIDTGEDYIVSGSSTTPSSILLDALDFQVGNAVGTVEDTLQITGGPDFVATSGQNVVLTSPSSTLSELSGLGFGGGTLFFAKKPTVELNENAADATVSLDATVGDTLENQFTVVTRSLGDTVVIGATPASVSTSVQVTGTDSDVVLQANSGFVSISGIETGSQPTTVVLGDFFQSIGDITQNIQADVSVSNVGTLILADFGNQSTNENVTVTQANISGTGLFGNNSVDVSYGNVGTVNLNSGQRQDEYTVETSSPSAKFTSKINLFDDSSVFLGAHVDLDANSHLNLSLFNETSKAGELFISAPGGKFSNQPEGIIDVSFNGVLSSQIDNQGFTVEEEHS